MGQLSRTTSMVVSHRTDSSCTTRHSPNPSKPLLSLPHPGPRRRIAGQQRKRHERRRRGPAHLRLGHGAPSPRKVRLLSGRVLVVKSLHAVALPPPFPPSRETQEGISFFQSVCLIILGTGVCTVVLGLALALPIALIVIGWCTPCGQAPKRPSSLNMPPSLQAPRTSTTANRRTTCRAG